ncbi:MAG: hypothetical protein Q7J54_07760 [Candidatus Woesearchaeota archaeon]|nr:hypothetical protein [Candidatus Woesearchaeota archaeon]
MEFTKIGKFRESLVKRVEKLFLNDFTNHEEVEHALNISSSPGSQYKEEAKNYQGQN